MSLQEYQEPSLFKQHGSAERRFLQLISALPKVSVQGYDKHRKVIYWNKSSEDMYGFREREALGQKLEDLIIPSSMKSDVINLHQRWLDCGEPIPSDELVLEKKSGEPIHVFSSHVMLKEGTDSPEMYCVDIDLSEQHTIRQELERMASTDLLTELPNRRLLEQFVTSSIEDASRDESCFALFFIDLDMFKEVNDTLGHTRGDELLRSVSKRLSDCLGKHGLLARFGGDEFVFVATQVTSENESADIAKKLTECFKQSFTISTENVYITSSIGISMYPKDGSEIDDLLKNADVAMYQAKAEGRNRFHFFTRALSQRVQQQRKIAAYLHESLVNDEFELLYQPQIDLFTGKVASCEALLRWCPENEERAVPPSVFIPIAERSELIVHIGNWVLEKACKQAQLWKEQGINIRVDINVSGNELEQNAYFERLRECRERHGLLPRDIGLELTENVLIKSDSTILDDLRALRDQGVEISIDDFGTGYSSLSYLKHFPVSHLKIDRSFLKGAPENAYDSALMEAIVNVGHKLDLNIVVEGVETQSQSNYCKSLNVEYVQGFLYSKPISSDAIVRLLSEK
ncbi:sensor domain-containing protein [Alteromonas sp. S015]|uniref:sensor domain-containing protein n=1 Tax=Alteromonas sp. S015 TaxID=3117401 RepID=UPI002FE3DE82